MRRYSFYILFLSVSLLITTAQANANCSCGPTGGSELYGMEFMAKSCAEEGDDDNTSRVYVSQSINCSNQTISSIFYPSEGNETPGSIINIARSYNMTKILRNEEGTHFIAVHRYYFGTVAGVSPGTGVTVIPNLNEYCTGDGGLPDNDLDSYPDCLDCEPQDPVYNENCIVIPKNLGKCL